MRSASFAVNLANRTIDESTLTWEHPTRILAARAFLVEDLEGSSPAWIRVVGPEGGCEFVFYPPCGAGSRRIATPGLALPLMLAAGQELKVWGVRAESGGLFRVELDFERVRRTECALASPEPRTARLAQRAGTW